MLTGDVAGAWSIRELHGDVVRLPTGPPRLLDQVRAAIRLRHYSKRTERAYVGWIRRFILFHGKRHPRAMGADEVTSFLSALARDRQVSASTQNQALAALLFLYGEVLEVRLPWLSEIVRAAPRRRLPVVLSREEVRDRVTLRPTAAVNALEWQIARVRRLHERDLAVGAGWVELPHALSRKYSNAGRELPWQWVFPATRIYTDHVSGEHRRHHLHETVVQRAVHRAVRLAGIHKHAPR